MELLSAFDSKDFIQIIVAVVSTYFILRERIVKIEVYMKVLNKQNEATDATLKEIQKRLLESDKLLSELQTKIKKEND